MEMDRTMPAITNKQQVIQHLTTALKKKYSASNEVSDRPVLEEILYAICREGVPSTEADEAFHRLRTTFFDWNEVRVSSLPEVAEVLAPLPDASTRAGRIIGFLQEVFEELYSFDLGDIAKKGLKQAAKQLSRYKSGVNDFVVAWVTQRTLGGHAIPMDAPGLRVIRRLHLVDHESEDLEAIRGTIEHFVPKAKSVEFTEQLVQFAAETCTETNPACPTCPMKTDCPTGQELLAKAKADAKAESKAKPKSR
jgi:endonuclease III